MGVSLTNQELAVVCKDAIDRGQHLTALFMRLRAEGYSIYDKRLKRIWHQQGGTTRKRELLYAPGTAPADYKHYARQ